MATLNIWTSPTTGEKRVYINTRFDVDAARIGIADADGSYFAADENGMCKAHYKSSYSGRIGDNTKRFAQLFEIDNTLSFAALVERVENAKGPRGAKFSEKVYFANLPAKAA